MLGEAIVKQIAIALALATLGAPCLAQSASGTLNVNIVLTAPGASPAPGAAPAPRLGLCTSQSLSEATGALVRVVCNPGEFVSIEPRPGSRFLGVHGGAFRYFFANGIPAQLRFLGGSEPWLGPGTITSVRINYPEGQDGAIEMLVGF